MKRIVLCLCAVLLLCTSLSGAFAATWFTEPGTARLHRDPFCNSTCLATALHAPAIWFDSIDAIYQQGEHTLCTACAGAFPDVQPLATTQTLYYDPEDGRYWHADPNCPTVNETYLPLAGTMAAEEAQQSSLTPCPVCNAVQPQDLRNAIHVWNAFLEAKTAMLPGVWTLPSEKAITPEEAWAKAAAYMETPSMAAHFPDGIFAHCLFHYDTAGEPQLAREHYRALVTTVLQEPVGLIYVDALTGEVYSATVVE